jgi:hypothetical protein
MALRDATRKANRPAPSNPGGVLLLLVLAACSRAPEPPAEPPDPLPAAEAARAMELGAPAANALATGLVGRLTRAMEEEGHAGAIAFCAAEAMPLTREIQAGHDPRLEVKRTTLRLRNPDNAPDPWEQRVLLYIEALERLDADSVPPELTARGPDGSLRYYRVLRTMPMCLACHGPADALDPAVQDVLRTHYPGDRATGYDVGEVRGVLRVQIPVNPAG